MSSDMAKNELPEWMLGGPDPEPLEPSRGSDGAPHPGWWTLPLAGWAWGEDAEEFEQ